MMILLCLIVFCVSAIIGSTIGVITGDTTKDILLFYSTSLTAIVLEFGIKNKYY